MDDTKQILFDEWKDVRETLRYFGNKRFAQLTVFLGAGGFLFDALLKQEDPFTKKMMGIVGFLGGFLFFLMELSSKRYWMAFSKRGEEIEKQGELAGTLKMMTERPKGEKWWSGTKSTYAVYLGYAAFMVIVGFAGRPSSASDVTIAVATVLRLTPTLTAKQQAAWSIVAVEWNKVTKAYDFTLVENGQPPDRLLMSIDGISGNMTKFSKTPSAASP